MPQGFGSEEVILELREPRETLETGANAAILRNRPVGGNIYFRGRGSSFAGPFGRRADLSLLLGRGRDLGAFLDTQSVLELGFNGDPIILDLRQE